MSLYESPLWNPRVLNSWLIDLTGSIFQVVQKLAVAEPAVLIWMFLHFFLEVAFKPQNLSRMLQPCWLHSWPVRISLGFLKFLTLGTCEHLLPGVFEAPSGICQLHDHVLHTWIIHVCDSRLFVVNRGI